MMPENIATPPPKEAKKSGFKEIVKRAVLGGSLLAGTASDTLPPKVESTPPEHTAKPPAGLVKAEVPTKERFEVIPRQLSAAELKQKIEEELGVQEKGERWADCASAGEEIRQARELTVHEFTHVVTSPPLTNLDFHNVFI